MDINEKSEEERQVIKLTWIVVIFMILMMGGCTALTWGTGPDGGPGIPGPRWD